MSNQAARRTRSLSADKRAAILAGAKRVFLRDGFAAGSVDAVAAEAGVGKQTVYRHFGSKDALVEALVVGMCEAIDWSAPPDASSDPRATLRRELNAFVLGLSTPGSVQLYRAIIGEAGRQPEFARLFFEAGPKVIRSRVASVLCGELPDSEASEAAAILVNLALGDAYLELVLGITPPDPKRFERQIDAALELVLPSR
ncbi:TetR/AcrR family transcriptional regulator [Qipengyuania qiaonensis]|uniref:TetR/AcrR family transcriptional regulator n=1 Tax=Qipengyuania qiaonensis TaxID=2867240 RepID=A0ABS7J9G5_9SPHN|nr:TetR/AcrR family transcriptional regulator [Qipengyuania qiaonensis]MBX7481617.1 TetR/AcrR family transcriptional regulator [Qipengyuania qiaonensis]